MKITGRSGAALFCYLCGILLWHTEAAGQRPLRTLFRPWSNGEQVHSSGAALRSVSRVQPRTVDWPSNPRREERLFEFLASEIEICLPGITIQQCADRVAQHVPVYMELAEVDLLGVDIDSKISRIQGGSVYAQLLAALNPFQLTIHFRRGVLVVTSIDDAESDPLIRTYEIAPVDSRRSYDFDSLMHQVRTHVDPDSWMVGGGCSAMTVFRRNDRWLLVVSAPFTAQLKTTALLEQLLPLSVYAQHQAAVPNRGSTLKHASHPSIYGIAADSASVARNGAMTPSSAHRSRANSSLMGFGHERLVSSVDHLK